MATVLVVDDRASNRELARTLLTYGGHQVIEASEGAEALALAHTRHPDLVLTDILMPGMDGYELARELRAAPDTAETIIVFYTANYAESETRLFAEACGVARVLLKSSEPHVLMQAIEEVLVEARVGAAPIDTAMVDREYLRAVSAKLFDKVKTLTDTETRFRLMADSSPVGIAFGDRHGSANYVNARLAEITGLRTEDLLGLGWLHCAGQDDHDEILAITRSREPCGTRHHYRNQVELPDHTLRWLNVQVRTVQDDDGEHAGFIATVDDVTTVVEADRQRLAAHRQRDIEAKDRATERLESLSTFAGGVAHDFNNILGSILGFEDFLSGSVTDLTATGRLEAEAGRALLADLAQIRKGGQRASGLTQQLLTFGMRKTMKLSALDLNQAILESNQLLEPTIGTHIRIVSDLGEDVRPVLAEPTAVAQILLNITINAAHAMSDGGTLTIVTRNADVADDQATGPTPAGQYARLTIRDTGHGMSPEALKRAVEPFFTTKGPGQGTGLGLATVYGIVNQLGGVLRLESTPDHGTAVTMYLPTTDQPAATAPRTATPARGTETILVAEDEGGIRDTLARSLTRAGYTVLVAAGAAEALALAERHPDPIHLLLSDVTMPGMLGDELAAHLLQRRPDTKVLFMSGYAGHLMNRYGILEPGVTVLPKPFTNDELLSAVRAGLGTFPTGPGASG